MLLFPLLFFGQKLSDDDDDSSPMRIRRVKRSEVEGDEDGGEGDSDREGDRRGKADPRRGSDDDDGDDDDGGNGGVEENERRLEDSMRAKFYRLPADQREFPRVSPDFSSFFTLCILHRSVHISIRSILAKLSFSHPHSLSTCSRSIPHHHSNDYGSFHPHSAVTLLFHQAVREKLPRDAEGPDSEARQLQSLFLVIFCMLAVRGLCCVCVYMYWELLMARLFSSVEDDVRLFFFFLDRRMVCSFLCSGFWGRS